MLFGMLVDKGMMMPAILGGQAYLGCHFRFYQERPRPKNQATGSVKAVGQMKQAR